jgi:hypothetical protein
VGGGGGFCLFTEYSILAPDSDLHLEYLFWILSIHLLHNQILYATDIDRKMT